MIAHAIWPVGAELGQGSSLPFVPKYPVANQGTWENAWTYAKMYDDNPNPVVARQAQTTITYLDQLDGPPDHDYFRDSLENVLGYDPGDDPDGDGWEPHEIKQEFGHAVERQARNDLFFNHPELFPPQTGQDYLSWLEKGD